MEDFKEESHISLDEEKSNVSVQDVGEKLDDMYNKLQEGIDSAFENTAKKMDSAADTIHGTAKTIDSTADSLGSTAKVVRNKNSEVLKKDFLKMVQKYPMRVISGAFVFGMLLGKMFSK